LIVVIAAAAFAGAAPGAFAIATAPPTTTATTSPTSDAPPVTNDLIPENNEVSNCIGTVEQANCGSKARADGHTYLVFAVLAAGMTFIGWRIARGVRARDAAHQPMP
jgi:hypothetical protein